LEPKRRDIFGIPARPVDSQGDHWLSVRELTELGRRAVEKAGQWVRVTGEVSNVTYAQSGHLYFTMKDSESQIAAVMWRTAVLRLPLRLADGMAVRAKGSLTIYPPSGRFQIVVEELTLAGRGNLEARLRELRRRYEELGYFAPERKRLLPFLPARVGIVTSPTGAAIHDILRVIRDRCPRIHVILAPVRVQGAGAAEEIAAAIALMNRHGACDVLIVGRGGGSFEDLWSFNEPVVIEAIFTSQIPVISAVGHEIDVTLADLVADVRALTPTNAAERVVPILVDLERCVADTGKALRRRIDTRLQAAALRLRALASSWALREPRRLLGRKQQHLDDLRTTLATRTRAVAERRRRKLEDLSRRLAVVRLPLELARLRGELEGQSAALAAALARRRAAVTARIAQLEAQLEALSPHRVLARGYSITLDAETGAVVRDAACVEPGARILSVLAQGKLESAAIAIRKDEQDASPSGF
jgi:exodeoxyribonuclease VII large subunit